VTHRHRSDPNRLCSAFHNEPSATLTEFVAESALVLAAERVTIAHGTRDSSVFVAVCPMNIHGMTLRSYDSCGRSRLRNARARRTLTIIHLRTGDTSTLASRDNRECADV